MSNKTVITKIIERDVVDAPTVKPKQKKFSFDSEEELEKWIKNKKMLADYPKIKEELDKIKKEKAAKEKTAKEKEMAEFKKWKDGVKKKDDEKKQNEKKEFEQWRTEKEKKLPYDLSIIIGLISIGLLFVFIVLASVMQPKIKNVDPLSLQELNKNRAFK